MKQFLIVVDMQKDFVDGALGTAEAQAIVPAVVEKIRNFSGEIFATFDTHGADYASTREGRHLPVPHCIKGTPGWELDGKVAQALSGKRFTPVEKPTFGSTALPGLLWDAANGADFSVELIGLCTDICVISNAMLLKAAFPEADIIIDSRCCAGVSPATHQAALQAMACCQMEIR